MNVHSCDNEEIHYKSEVCDKRTDLSDYHLNQRTYSQGLKWQEHECKEETYTAFSGKMQFPLVKV